MARSNSAGLTDAELRLMDVVWQKGEATVSDVVCAGDYVGAFIDQSASGLAVLLRRQNGTLTTLTFGENICGQPDVQSSPPQIRTFFNC